VGKRVTVAYLRRQLARGERVELEHTSDPRIARKIATDHLLEFPDYYERLAVMERQARKVWK
jgi:hypothetical protein